MKKLLRETVFDFQMKSFEYALHKCGLFDYIEFETIFEEFGNRKLKVKKWVTSNKESAENFLRSFKYVDDDFFEGHVIHLSNSTTNYKPITKLEARNCNGTKLMELQESNGFSKDATCSVSSFELVFGEQIKIGEFEPKKKKKQVEYKYGKCPVCKISRNKNPIQFMEGIKNCVSCQDKRLIKSYFVIEYIEDVIHQWAKGNLTMSCHFRTYIL